MASKGPLATLHKKGPWVGIHADQWKTATSRQPWGYRREEECELTLRGQGHLQAAEFLLTHLPLLTLYG